jgi:hypothetical protein
MIKAAILAVLCTLTLSSAQLVGVRQRLRNDLKVKSTSMSQHDAFGHAESNLEGGNGKGRILHFSISMSMTVDGISTLDIDDADEADDAGGADDAQDADGAVDDDGAVDADDTDEALGTEGAADWICQFCPSFLCINCA